ncbi:Hachiman antiphage defense system protein HamA [Capnocytophaga cynodegmi]|uniref:Hachiman antiphage defense system protein HamA n=1 Tax=Capnocytophaga cynodegmi TaxID=28189 RepID=UPI00385F7F1C
MAINWEEKIKIDTQWTNRLLANHFTEKSSKITVRAYTPLVAGTKFCCNALIQELGFLLIDYVHTDKSKKDRLKGLEATYGKNLAKKRLDTSLYQEASSFFGKKNPQTDGKYGELLLFALCESILKCKMVAHKIQSLSNGKDQVKGGDGVYLGNYELADGKKESAIFIGEAKIMQHRSDAITDALNSLNRFHDSTTQSEFNNMELLVASKTLSVDESDVDYEEIYERLTMGSEKYMNQIMVHPILLMYNTTVINKLETQSTSKEHLEELIKNHLIADKQKMISTIEKNLNKFPEIKKVYVDFFCFPFNDIDKFRNGMYERIHGVQYANG